MDSEAAKKILCVDDDEQVRQFLVAFMSAQGFEVIEAASGMEALESAERIGPDLIILDLGLPDIDGLLVTRRLREWSDTPIIVLSGRGAAEDKRAALEAGANDYVSKPFVVRDLLHRMRMVMRREEPETEQSRELITLGQISIDLAHQTVTVAGMPVELSPVEFKLLAELARHAGRVLTDQYLLKNIFGEDSPDQAYHLRVHMVQLRRKIETDSSLPSRLLIEPGVGYRLMEDEAA